MRKRYAMIAILTFLISTILPTKVDANNTLYDYQGFYQAIWVNAFEPGLKTPEEIDKLVKDAKAANINAIMAQVSRRHDAYYLSDYLPFTQDPDVPDGFDPLGYLISQAKGQGIEVHAWVVVGCMWHSKYGGPPEDPDHIWQRYGPDAPMDKTWITMGFDGSKGDRMNPYIDLGHPEAREHVVNLVTDIVKNYDVDGVHLDYIRYPENPRGKPAGWYGYNPTAVSRFQNETGRRDKPQPEDAQWLAWRVKQVDTLIHRIYLEVKSIDKDKLLTAAVLSWGMDDPRIKDWRSIDTVRRAQQDWKKWVQEGYLDYAFVMNYDANDNPIRAKRYQDWIEWQKDLPRSRGIIIGPAIYQNSISHSIDQIRKAMSPSPTGNAVEGVSLYVYNVWSNDGSPQEDLISSLSYPTVYNGGAAPFTQPIATPSLTLKPGKLLPGHILIKVMSQGTPLAGVEAVLTKWGNKAQVKRDTTDANGYFAVSDLEPGYYYFNVVGDTGEELIRIMPDMTMQVDVEKK